MISPLINTAQMIAARAHSGQTRRDGFTPYFNHLAAVAHAVRNESASVIAAAWLHDVIEDTHETVESLLKAGIPASVVTAVDLLTKKEGVSYEFYIRQITGNWIARRVKFADILCNLHDEPTDKQIRKYVQALSILSEKL